MRKVRMVKWTISYLVLVKRVIWHTPSYEYFIQVEFPTFISVGYKDNYIVLDIARPLIF